MMRNYPVFVNPAWLTISRQDDRPVFIITQHGFIINQQSMVGITSKAWWELLVHQIWVIALTTRKLANQ